MLQDRWARFFYYPEPERGDKEKGSDDATIARAKNENAMALVLLGPFFPNVGSQGAHLKSLTTKTKRREKRAWRTVFLVLTTPYGTFWGKEVVAEVSGYWCESQDLVKRGGGGVADLCRSLSPHQKFMSKNNRGDGDGKNLFFQEEHWKRSEALTSADQGSL